MLTRSHSRYGMTLSLISLLASSPRSTLACLKSNLGLSPTAEMVSATHLYFSFINYRDNCDAGVVYPGVHHFLSKSHVAAGSLPEGLVEYNYDEEPSVMQKPFTAERAWSLFDKLSHYISEKNKNKGIWTKPEGERVKYRSQAAIYADHLESVIEDMQSELDQSRASDSDASDRPTRARTGGVDAPVSRRGRGGSRGRGGRSRGAARLNETSKLQLASSADESVSKFAVACCNLRFRDVTARAEPDFELK